MSREEMILICAVRYALGRMSYAVDDVCEYIECGRKKLSKECINVLIKDIEEELDRYHNAGKYLGMECDEKQWTRLLEALRGEVKHGKNTGE